MKILMLGAGGTGGYFGMRWIKAGADLTFLVRPKRQSQLQTNGLVVQTPQETLTHAVQTVTLDTLSEPYDLVVLSPKSYDLESAIDAVKAVAGQPIILPLLNGLDHIDRLDQAFTQDRVMGGVVHIAATLTADGVVKQLSPMHKLTIGQRSPTQRHVQEALARLSADCPFDFMVSPNITQTLWDKWVFLATLAGTTTLLRANVGQIMETPWGEAIMTQTYENCCRVASVSGFPIGNTVREQALKMLLEQNSTFTSSMLRDVQAGLPTEHEHILGALARRAEKFNVSCPTILLAYTALRIAG